MNKTFFFDCGVYANVTLTDIIATKGFNTELFA